MRAAVSAAIGEPLGRWLNQAAGHRAGIQELTSLLLRPEQPSPPLLLPRLASEGNSDRDPKEGPGASLKSPHRSHRTPP